MNFIFKIIISSVHHKFNTNNVNTWIQLTTSNYSILLFSVSQVHNCITFPITLNYYSSSNHGRLGSNHCETPNCTLLKSSLYINVGFDLSPHKFHKQSLSYHSRVFALFLLVGACVYTSMWTCPEGGASPHTGVWTCPECGASPHTILQKHYSIISALLLASFLF